MITEDYCSYEVAKLLKEKGFNEPCRAYWDDQPKLNVHTLFFSVEPIRNSKLYILTKREDMKQFSITLRMM